MIQDQESILKYSQNNKIYIPEDSYNSNWKYTLNGDTITIITNLNCTQNYNSTYCDCKQYNLKYNIMTQSYSCNSNPSSQLLNHSYISTDINDSIKITNDFTKDYFIMFGVLIIALLLTSVLKKNSRRL